MQKKHINLLPKRLLWRLTIVNVLVIGVFIAASGWAIYQTACFLFGDLGSIIPGSQGAFNASLLHYLILFSIAAIIVASFIHLYVTKVMIRPLEKLIDSTSQMKSGHYPEPIHVKSGDEIGQLARQFNELTAQLKENESHRQKLVSDLSHELRTPLANLNGYLSALKDGVIEGDSQLYADLHSELQRLTHLMNQLDKLESWQTQKTKQYSDKEKVAVQGLVDRALAMFQLELQRKNIASHTQIEAEEILMNEADMIQVLSNLIQNAIQYYDGTKPIEIKGQAIEGFYRLAVTGPSYEIKEPDREQIFDRFYRLDKSRTRMTGGSGLGLAISKEIVELHGGQIGLESDGSQQSFWFTLPLE